MWMRAGRCGGPGAHTTRLLRPELDVWADRVSVAVALQCPEQSHHVAACSVHRRLLTA